REERLGADCRWAVCEFLREGGRSQHRAWHAARDGDDFRTRNTGGAGVPAGREELTYGEKSYWTGEAANSRGQGDTRAAGRHRVGSAGRQHHGLLQGVQRKDVIEGPGGVDYPGRDYDLLGPVVHVHHEDAAGPGADQAGGELGEGVGRAA